MANTQIRGANVGTGVSQIQPGTISNADIHVSAAIATTKLAQGANFLQRDGSVALTANLPAGGFTVSGLGAPVGANDAVRLVDLQTVQTGLDVKASVRVATTVNISLSGTQTVDGVALSSGDRILVKDQATGSANGIYVVAAGAWSRTTDADVSAEVTSGMMVYVSEGTSNGTSNWILNTPDPITLGTTSLTFVQFNGLGQVTAGTGLTKSGNTLSIDSTVVTLAGTQTLTNKSIDAAQLTGTITVGRLPALTGGDVTSSAGSGTLTIGTGAVTYAKIQNVSATNRLLGRATAGAGVIEEITIGSGLSLAGSTLSATATGTVTTVSVVTANGFAGTVANASTTPAITISTSITGLLKGDGTAISAATLGTDYVKNSSFVTREVPSGSINGANTVFTTANMVTSGTESVYLNGMLQQGGGEDYTFSLTNTITFVSAPISGDRILVSYMK